MSSEVCPFCGKSFKRLKSHLPHCKANAQTPAAGRHVGASQTTSSSSSSSSSSSAAQRVADARETKGPSPTKLKSSPKASPASSGASSPPSLPPSVKKKRQKLSEQIKSSVSTSSPSTSSSSSSSPSPPSVSKPKKTSLRALIEAAKSSPASFEGTKQTKLAPEELSSGSTLVSRNARTSSTRVTTDQAGASDADLTDVPKKKATKTKRAKQAPPTRTPDSPDPEPPPGNTLWVDVVKRSEGSATSEKNLQTRVFIQDAKSILGRTKPGKAKILDWTETTQDAVRKTRLDSGWTPPAGNPKDSGTTEAALEQLAQIKSLMAPESKESSLIPVERKVPSQLKLFVPESAPPPPAVVGRHVTELLTLSSSPAKFSSPRILPVVPQSAAPRAEPARAGDWPRREGPNQDAEVTRRRRLGQVKLRELPDWLLSRTPSHPKDVVEMVQRGWQWYYRRYIDVKKGGVGGLGMLLVGYCALSYIWSYPHIKLDRWRKYH